MATDRSGCSVHQATYPLSGGEKVVIVRPDEPEHRPTRDLAQLVLAALLAKYSVAGGITGLQETPVLNATVELAEEPKVAPRPVAGASNGAVLSLSLIHI